MINLVISALAQKPLNKFVKDFQKLQDRHPNLRIETLAIQYRVESKIYTPKQWLRFYWYDIRVGWSNVKSCFLHPLSFFQKKKKGARLITFQEFLAEHTANTPVSGTPQDTKELQEGGSIKTPAHPRHQAK